MPTGRPKKEESEKAKESFVVRLDNENLNILNSYAYSLKVASSSVVTRILRENGCFDYDIDDELYIKLLKFPEAGQTMPRSRTPVRELKIIRCWITKKEKKSLIYYALMKHNVSPSVLANDLLKNFLLSIKQEPQKIENKADIIVKDLWQNVSDETKKELTEEYLKSK
jgi:hypothetical protein